jgi:hypothetical protein
MQKAFFLGQSARSEEADDIGKRQKSRLLTSLKASVEFGMRPAQQAVSETKILVMEK